MKKLLLLIIVLPLCLGTAFGQLTKDRADSAASHAVSQRAESEKKETEQPHTRPSADRLRKVMVMGGAALNTNYTAYSLLLGYRVGKRLTLYAEGETNNFVLNPYEEYKVYWYYGSDVFWSGERKVCRSNLTAGAIYNFTKWLGVRAGAGYGFYSNLCQTIGGKWLDVSNLTTYGRWAFELEAGVVLNLGGFLVGAGLQHCRQSVTETNISIGYTF